MLTSSRKALHVALAIGAVLAWALILVLLLNMQHDGRVIAVVILILCGVGIGIALYGFTNRQTIRAGRAPPEPESAETQTKLTSLFDNTAIGLRWIGRDGRILRANRAELEMLGYSEDEYIGRPLADFHIDPAGIADMLKRLEQGEVLRNCAVQLRAKDSSIKHVLMDCNPVHHNGEFLHIQCFTRDITDRRRAEEDAKESEERFRFLADKAPLLIWMSGPTMAFDYLNKSWLEFTGRSFEEEFGDGWLESIHPEDRQSTWDCYSSAFQARREFTLEYRFRRYDGAYRWVLNTGIPRFTLTGFFFGYIGSCVDITDRKLWEQEQQRALAALEEIDRRKDEFLAVLSHELRNPLAPILNALHILRVSNLADQGAREARAVIERQIQLMAGIVDDLLDVFRISHQKLTLRKEALNIATLVRTSVDDHRIAMNESGLKLQIEIPREPVWILADRTRLSQVLSNVFNNTAKFTNPGDSVSIQVAQDDRRGQAVVTIRDTGIGVAPDVLPCVFETFTQADRSIDRSKGGLGLGLALVKGLVELHGGEVAMQSPGLGLGATLTIRFPLGKAPLDVVSSVAPSSIMRPLSILIVEDNRDTARTLGVLLSRSGHHVKLAHTGTEGVEFATKDPPDVVLCDLGLPEMDGFEVAQTLRKDPALHSTRMIAVSGYGQEEDRQRTEAAGFDLHLTKPVDPADLQRLLAVLKVGP